MTLYELNEMLRGMHADQLKNINVEYLDNLASEQFAEEFFRSTSEARLVLVELDSGEYAYSLRLV